MRPRRPGYTFIEIVVVVTIVGLLLTLVSGMVHTLLKREATERAARRTRHSLLDLSYRFRRDALLAESGHIASDSCELRLSSGETILYRSEERGISRQRSLAGNRPQREFFGLEGVRGTFESSPRHDRLLRLLIRPHEAASVRFEIPTITVSATLPTAVAKASREKNP